jgi:hypothetical protein
MIVTQRSHSGFCQNLDSDLILYLTVSINNNMSRQGPRPHTWKYQDPLEHLQHVAWMRMKAQADFRGEPWDFSFEDFKTVWGPHWPNRGRASEDYCLTRCDYEMPWSITNVECIRRIDHLKRNRQGRQFHDRPKNNKIRA